jgi:hypothetical protein
LADNLLELKLFLRKNSMNYLFLQIDNNLEHLKPSNISLAEAMPFLSDSVVFNHSKQFIEQSEALKSIPFYRYALNDAKIGFRELLLSALHKKPAIDLSDGFTPRFGNSIPDGPVQKLEETIGLKQNPILEQIKTLCQKHHVRLVLFISPYCSKMNIENYIQRMKKIEPGLIDLSRGYDDALFFNCGHLNAQGAEVFTRNLYLSTKESLSSK